MDRKQFVAAIEHFEKNITDAHEILGISRATVYRIVAGESKVPPVIARLLFMYLTYDHVPDDKQIEKLFRKKKTKSKAS